MSAFPNDATAQELGLPAPTPPPATDMPVGDGTFVVPHFDGFSAVVQTLARTYRWTFDEALRQSRPNAMAMGRDAVIFAALRARQMPTAGLSWHVEPADEDDPVQAEAAKVIEQCVQATPNFAQMRMQLLNALWFGRYAVQLTYTWDTNIRPGKPTLRPRSFVPINGDKLRFKWDGTPGILVSSRYPGSTEVTDWGLAHFCTPAELDQLIVHEFEPEDSDWLEGEMAGAIHGVGFRGRLYWYWWMRSQLFALLMDYLERFAHGMTVYYYDAHNPNAKAEAEAAAKAQFTNNSILYPRWTQGNASPNGVERLEVGTASPAVLGQQIQYFDDVIRQAILGQTLSSTTEGSGLGGSGVAELHGDTLANIIKYDATLLADTLQRDLVNVLYRHNYPGVRPGKFVFEVDDPNTEEMFATAERMLAWGMALPEDDLYKISKWAKPKPGKGVVSMIGAMQPAAVGGAPTGVPVAGEAGPADQSQQPVDPNAPMPAQPDQGSAPNPSGGLPPVRQSRKLPIRVVRSLSQPAV